MPSIRPAAGNLHVIIPALFALMCASVWGDARAESRIAVAMPAGFSDLARAQRIVTDLYFGG